MYVITIVFYATFGAILVFPIADINRIDPYINHWCRGLPLIIVTS